MRAVFCIFVLLGSLLLQPAFAAHGWGGGGRFADTGFHGGSRGGPPPRMQRPPPPRPPEMRGPGPQGMPPRLPPNEAAHRAQMISGGGRVLAVDPASSGYRVRVLKDGEVRSIYVPQ
jgi:hypothetical protein